MTFVIAEPCVDVLDKSCMEQCPVDCIYEGDRMLYIQPDECVDCGACVPACPMDAVFDAADLPEQWRPFQRYAVEVFATIGMPGGATDHGRLNVDHPDVLARPEPAPE